MGKSGVRHMGEMGGWAKNTNTSWTRPRRNAVGASTGRPLRRSGSAARLPMARARATPGVWQKRPIRVPGVAKLAAWCDTATSHVAASWQPAACAAPCTAAMTGAGAARMVDMRCEQSEKTRAASARSRVASSRRSWPLQKAAPAAAITTARVRPGGSAATNSRVVVRVRMSSLLSAFRASGRFSVSVRMRELASCDASSTGRSTDGRIWSFRGCWKT